MSFGITSNNGITAPAGYRQEVVKTQSVDVATIKDENGVTKVAKAKPIVKTTVTIKCKGASTLATLATGAFSGLTVTNAKVSETNDDFPTSEVSATQYS